MKLVKDPGRKRFVVVAGVSGKAGMVRRDADTLAEAKIEAQHLAGLLPAAYAIIFDDKLEMVERFN